MLQKLSEVDLFQRLTTEELHEVLSAAMPLRHLPTGHVLFRQGEPAEVCYALLSGSAHLTQQDIDGHEVVLSVLRASHIVGIAALIEEATYSTDAQIVQPAVVLAWPRSEMQRLMQRHAAILRNALRIAVTRYVELQQNYQLLAFQSVSRRLARALLTLAHDHPPQSDGSIPINITREHLAAMVVTTIFTTSRLLTEWERSGILTLQRGMVIIRNREALVSIASHPSDALHSS